MNQQDSDKEPSEWEDPYKAPPPSPSSSSWLRFFVWLGPAVTIFLLVLLFSSLRSVQFSESLLWLLAFSTAIVFGIGDAHLRMRKSGGSKDKLIEWTIIFTLCQVIVTPLIWFLGIFGFCAFAASY